MPDPTRTRSFSIFLLKRGFDHESALIDENRLGHPITNASIPVGSTLYVQEGELREPWWRLYFGITHPLLQGTKSAILFLPSAGRTFALCFGHVAHNLRDESYEYDFGLLTTLNCVDPQKLKNTDVMEPGAARRQRTQVSVDSDLTFFDFDSDSTVLRSLTGAVRHEYEHLIRNVTGSSNLRISARARVEDLTALCEQLLTLYMSDAFQHSFPEVQNVSPVRDPALITQLDEALATALRDRSDSPQLTIPELIEYNDSFWVQFTGQGRSDLHHDVYLARYYAYLDDHGFDYASIGVDSLRRHKLALLNDDTSPRTSFAIYKCLIFDTQLPGDSSIYHLMEGNWFKFESDYVRRVTKSLSPYLVADQMPECHDQLEADYNMHAVTHFSTAILLDKANMSPRGQTQVEPCDVLFESADGAVFCHVKFSTVSSQLSHLFNQGSNAMQLLRSADGALVALEAAIHARASDSRIASRLLDLVKAGQMSAHYAIVTHKNPAGGVDNLPLFSRLSLARAMRSFRAMGIVATFEFVPDRAPDRPGTPKPRKPRFVADSGS